MDTNRLQQTPTSNATLLPAEIAFLQQEIARLDQVIATATSDRQRYHMILSPLRRNAIPPEVLGEIFSYIALADMGSGPKVHQRLLDLCLVCKAWRQAAMSCPRLWCHLRDFELHALAPNHFDRATVWLNRGGVLPKHLEFIESHGTEGPTHRVNLPALPCSLSNSSLARPDTLP